MIQEATARLIAGESLMENEVRAVVGEMMGGEATHAQMAGFLVALRMHGEDAEILTGAARAMREHGVKVETKTRPLADTCGTGGDGKGTFNVSTAAAFVVAGAGQAVAKHGNRAASGKSGGADCLEALGVVIEMAPEDVAEAIDSVGVGFLFAPVYHPSMRHVAPVRRELGVRTVMNLLGPLTNPAGADRQVIGVGAVEHLGTVAETLARLGTEHSLVIHGRGGYDEITPMALTDAIEVRSDGSLRELVLDPQALGLPACQASDLDGRDADHSAAVVRAVLEGAQGPARDTVLLNAAAVLYVSDRAADLREGLEMARRAIDTGEALGRLEALRSLSRKAARLA